MPIDIVTDQTSAPTTRCRYLPEGIALEDWAEYAEKKPEEFTDRARASMAKHVQAMVDFMDAGAEVFDYGNSIRDEARQGGYERAFDFPGFVPAYIRPLFCEGKGPFRWAALSGDPKDIAATDQAVLDLFPDNDQLHKWIRGAQERIAFQGLPARICWLGYGERDKAGLAFNDLVRTGEVQAPDRHRPRPPRQRLGRQPLPRDRGDARRLRRDRRLAAAQRAGQHARPAPRWVSIHHGGGVGIGRSLHAGQVSLADGTDLAAQKLARVLTNDPGMGVIRHVDAGYDIAERRSRTSAASASRCARAESPAYAPGVQASRKVAASRSRVKPSGSRLVHLVAGVEGDRAAVGQGRHQLGDVLGRDEAARPARHHEGRRDHGRHDRGPRRVGVVDLRAHLLHHPPVEVQLALGPGRGRGRRGCGIPTSSSTSRRTRSGCAAATRSATSPPSECPTRSTGARRAASSSAARRRWPSARSSTHRASRSRRARAGRRPARRGSPPAMPPRRPTTGAVSPVPRQQHHGRRRRGGPRPLDDRRAPRPEVDRPPLGHGQAGSVTSATSAPRARTTSSAATVAATPCAPAPSDTRAPGHRRVGDDRPRGGRPERRDRAALVAR